MHTLIYILSSRSAHIVVRLQLPPSHFVYIHSANDQIKPIGIIHSHFWEARGWMVVVVVYTALGPYKGTAGFRALPHPFE